jgi:hypothetical protein
MDKIVLVLTTSLLMLARAGPAQAQPDDVYETYHDYNHNELDQDHHDERDYLEELHREVHRGDMSPWEHRLLRRYIERGHAPEHREIGGGSRRENGKSQWDSRYSGWMRYNHGLLDNN